MITILPGNGVSDDYQRIQDALDLESIYLPLSPNQAGASGILTTTGNFSNNETLFVANSTYTAKATLTANTQYQFLIGATTAISLKNFEACINNWTGEGTTYGAFTPPNSSAKAIATATTLILTALSDGSSGNAVPTTETCANASFASATLLGGVDSYKMSLCLNIPSNRKIECDPGTVISRLDGTVSASQTVLFRNADWVYGNKNIIISGGTWDGNGFNQTRVDVLQQAICQMVNVDNLLIENVQFKNPVCFCANFGKLRDAEFRNIGFYQDAYIQNGDGLHFSGDCYGGRIKGTWGRTYDDMVALVCYEDAFFTAGVGSIGDFVVEDMNSKGGCRGIRMLSAGGYTIDNGVVRNCNGNFTHGGITMGNFIFGGDNLISNILIDGVTLNKITGNADFPASSESTFEIDGNLKSVTIKNFNRTDAKSDSVVKTKAGFTYEDFTMEGFHVYEAGGGRVHLALGGVNKTTSLLNSYFRYTGASADGGYLMGNMASLTADKILLHNVNTDKIQVIYRDAATSSITDLQFIDCNFNTFHSVIFTNSAATLTRTLFNGTTLKNALDKAIFCGGGSSMPSISFQNSAVVTAPYLLYLDGTLSVAPKIEISGLKTSSIATALIGRSASQAFSLNTVDYPFDRSLLTPLTNDVVLDLTNGLQRWSGSAWVNP